MRARFRPRHLPALLVGALIFWSLALALGLFSLGLALRCATSSSSGLNPVDIYGP